VSRRGKNLKPSTDRDKPQSTGEGMNWDGQTEGRKGQGGAPVTEKMGESSAAVGNRVGRGWLDRSGGGTEKKVRVLKEEMDMDHM